MNLFHPCTQSKPVLKETSSGQAGALVSVPRARETVSPAEGVEKGLAVCGDALPFNSLIEAVGMTTFFFRVLSEQQKYSANGVVRGEIKLNLRAVCISAYFNNLHALLSHVEVRLFCLRGNVNIGP